MANPRISKKPKVARQYELSQAHIQNNSTDSEISKVFRPGGLPDMPAEGLAPDNRPHINRGNETSKNNSKNKEFYLGLEGIDEAIFYYFENVIKPSVISNGDLVDVPVIYGSGERWKLAQKDGYYRDKFGKVQAPLVMLKRETIEKRRDLGNKLDANNPQLYVTYQERYTQRNTYDQFSLLNNRIPQKEYTATVVPDYVNLTYQGIIWTDYISQLNKVIEAINYASDAYWGDPERFKFMAMIDQFTNITEVNNDDNRIVRANFSLKLQGYIVPDNVQKKLKEQNTRYFSKAQIVLNQATTVLDEDAQKSTRSRTITTSGGSSFTQTSTSTAVESDNDWLITDTYLEATKDVRITNNNLLLSLDNNNELDYFLVKKDNIATLKINNKGNLVLSSLHDSKPVAGGMIYHLRDNEFYFGFRD